MMENRKGGFWEWVKWYDNILRGCKNGCIYCYAMLNAVFRYHGVASYEAWMEYEILHDKLKKEVKHREGVGMFPSTHDLFPAILDITLERIREHLEANNKLLIVTKPWTTVVNSICNEFIEHQDQIQFRFTITSKDDSQLKQFEPNAPLYKERLAALMFAREAGFTTSVSIEPFLDEDPIPLIKDVEYWCDQIWLGRMNHVVHFKKMDLPPGVFDHVERITNISNLIKIKKNIHKLPSDLQQKIEFKHSDEKDTFELASSLTKNKTLTQWL